MKSKPKQQTWNEFLQTKLFKDFIFYIMIAIVIVLSVYLIMKVDDDSIRCLAEPWSYKLKSISSSTNQSITCSCSCSFLNQGELLYITKDNITILNTFNSHTLNNHTLNSYILNGSP